MEHDNSLAENAGMKEFDPRLSLSLAVTGMVGVFAAGNWLQLALLAGIALPMLAWLGALPDFWRRLYWLRWFLLFVVILHLLLTPGYTLLGVAWLSYDGLVRGLMVDSQVVVAMAAALVLTRVTSVGSLASAAAELFRPLRILGVDSDKFAGQILLSLHFVPILKEQVAIALAQAPTAVDRFGKARFMIETLTTQLVRHGDDLASAAAAGDTGLPIVERLNTFWPLAPNSWYVVGAALVVVLIYFGLA